MNEKAVARETANERELHSVGKAPEERMARMLDPDILGSLTIDLVAQLGRGTMTIHELANLDPGQVLRLDTPLNGVVDVSLNGTLVGRGEIVAVEGLFGIRITEILVRKL